MIEFEREEKLKLIDNKYVKSKTIFQKTVDRTEQQIIDTSIPTTNRIPSHDLIHPIDYRHLLSDRTRFATGFPHDFDFLFF